MLKIPKFLIYGENDSRVVEVIQPRLAFRRWGDLKVDEKRIALQELRNNGWVGDYSDNILKAVEHLNKNFLRKCPGKNLHKIIPRNDYSGNNEYARKEAALKDFEFIVLNDESDAMILRMLTKFMETYIDRYYLKMAEETSDEGLRNKNIAQAFNKFDRLGNCLNHIFDQFCINGTFTRRGFVPRQDEKITEEVYVPTLKILSDPKWKAVSDDLTDMFEDYQKGNFPEVITKAHSVIQRFLQILVGDEGRNAKGEVSKLFDLAKKEGFIPDTRLASPIITAFQGFIVSERATNSTAKPALKKATSSEALLVMNVVMIFLQYCLQE